MASEIQTYSYDGTKPITLVKWKIKKGGQLFYNSVILSYKQEDGNVGDGKEPLLKYKSNLGGTVSELIAKEGDVINTGAPLLKVEPCTHPVIMKDLCAECGADLRQLDRGNFEKLTAATTFSMVHVVPELKVSLEQAEKLGQDDEDRLLKNRKLVLLVDLDQTLIHTTNDNVPQNLPDVHHFQLYGPFSPWYHTNLRPGTSTFLENISKYYELHICTFGARLYAHKIAQILDPDGKLFSHRILSRDECFDATSKTGNLKALFPRGDDMVCIIDDREDVWNFAPNVIHVKPYSYFRNTGDINAPPPPPLLSNPKEAESSNPTVNTPSSAAENSPPKADASAPPDKNAEDLKDSIKEETAKEEPTAISKGDSCTSNEVADLKPPETDSKADCSEADKLHEKSGNTKTECSKNVSNSKTSETNNIYVNSHNSDDYLLYLEEILINVHKSYYEIYDQMKKEGKKGIPDMKAVVPYVRSKVLKGVRMVFSSVIPTNCVPESHHLWTLAESLGAHVFRELNVERKQRTTHVVASKQGTAKVNAAKRVKGIHVVSLDWLLCCAERWEHADERLFPLAKDSQATSGENENSSFSYHDSVVVKSRLKRPHSSKRKQNDKEQQKKDDKFSERIFVEAGLSLSLDDIEDMDREVEAACSEESENEADNSASSDSSSTGESLSSGDYPRGWKKLKKCEDEEDIDERDLVTSDSSDADTIGSVDEEIAEAVKQEFGNC